MMPNDHQVKRGTSTPKDLNFGGNREWGNTADDADYTIRTGAAPTTKENPVDTVVRDTDEMANPRERKIEFTYQERKANVQENNKANWEWQSDSDRLPDPDNDTFIPDPSDPNFKIKTRTGGRLKWQIGEGQYSNDPNRGVGTYEGEIS
jgi:hypothetical protein